MSNDEKFDFESLQDPKSIQAFMESLIKGLECGRIELSSNGEQIFLQPSSLLHFRVKAKRKRDESQISLKIAWKNVKLENLAQSPPLVISTE